MLTWSIFGAWMPVRGSWASGPPLAAVSIARPWINPRRVSAPFSKRFNRFEMMASIQPPGVNLDLVRLICKQSTRNAGARWLRSWDEWRIPALEMGILDKIDIHETANVEVDFVSFRGGRRRGVRNPAHTGGAAGEDQEGGGHHGLLQSRSSQGI